MQYIYTECELPSNGVFYSTRVVHLRPKTIFDIKTLLSNPTYLLKSEIDTLQNCIDPRDNVNVYDLVNQDVVYLLYKLRSLSDDSLKLTIKGKEYYIKISDLDIKYLQSWDCNIKLPVSGLDVILTYQPIRNIFEIEKQQKEFEEKYPDYKYDIYNTLNILNSISSIDGSVTKDHIRSKLETLNWKDSIYLINKIEENNKLDFGIVEEAKLNIDGEDVTVPIQITEEFFRPSL